MPKWKCTKCVRWVYGAGLMHMMCAVNLETGALVGARKVFGCRQLKRKALRCQNTVLRRQQYNTHKWSAKRQWVVDYCWLCWTHNECFEERKWKVESSNYVYLGEKKTKKHISIINCCISICGSQKLRLTKCHKRKSVFRLIKKTKKKIKLCLLPAKRATLLSVSKSSKDAINFCLSGA